LPRLTMEIICLQASLRLDRPALIGIGHLRSTTEKVCCLARPGSSRRNILVGIWIHPHYLNPDRRILLRGRAMAVRCSDQALSAVRSAFGPIHVVQTVGSFSSPSLFLIYPRSH
jgi:hypothetical protein